MSSGSQYLSWPPLFRAHSLLDFWNVWWDTLSAVSKGNDSWLVRCGSQRTARKCTEVEKRCKLSIHRVVWLLNIHLFIGLLHYSSNNRSTYHQWLGKQVGGGGATIKPLFVKSQCFTLWFLLELHTTSYLISMILNM